MKFQTLKKHDYFGKFGKILKVVINQSTSYIGTQVRLYSNEINLKDLNTTQLCLSSSSIKHVSSQKSTNYIFILFNVFCRVQVQVLM